MADNKNDNSLYKNSNVHVNNNGPMEPRIKPPITAPTSPKISEKQLNDDQKRDVLKERMQRYAKFVNNQKEKMMEVDKEKLVDVIFKQNGLITQQSNQMIDLVNLMKEIDASESQGYGESQTCIQNAGELQKNISILKKRNELCQEANQMREDNASLYSSSVKIQFVLFTLFIIVLLWLLYHFITSNE